MSWCCDSVLEDKNSNQARVNSLVRAEEGDVEDDDSVSETTVLICVNTC